MEEAIEQEKEFWKKTKCYFIGGGSVLLQQEKNSFYFTPFKTEHHLFKRGFSQNAVRIISLSFIKIKNLIYGMFHLEEGIEGE